MTRRLDDTIRWDVETGPAILDAHEAAAQLELGVGLKGSHGACARTLTPQPLEEPSEAELDRMMRAGARLPWHNQPSREPSHPSRFGKAFIKEDEARKARLKLESVSPKPPRLPDEILLSPQVCNEVTPGKELSQGEAPQAHPPSRQGPRLSSKRALSVLSVVLLGALLLVVLLLFLLVLLTQRVL